MSRHEPASALDGGPSTGIRDLLQVCEQARPMLAAGAFLGLETLGEHWGSSSTLCCKVQSFGLLHNDCIPCFEQSAHQLCLCKRSLPITQFSCEEQHREFIACDVLRRRRASIRGCSIPAAHNAFCKCQAAGGLERCRALCYSTTMMACFHAGTSTSHSRKSPHAKGYIP